MEQLRKSERPVIVLRNSSHGIVLHKTEPITPYSYFDRIVRGGSSAVLQPNGQIDMHGTPSEEGTFQLAGHWLECDRADITLLEPSKRPQSLRWGFLRSAYSGWQGMEVLLHAIDSDRELLAAEHIIIFGNALIACDWGLHTRVYPLKKISYIARPFRVRQIPVGNPSPVPVSP